MILALAALALVVVQDGGRDAPPPGPVPTELSATFAGAIRRNPAYAAAKGRVIQPDMQGALLVGAPLPGWLVEFHWKEAGNLRGGLAMIIDAPAADKINPGFEKASLAMREGRWVAAKVYEGETYAHWAEQAHQQRLANNESMTVMTIRSVISAEAVFESLSGSYGEFRCLSQPAACLPGSKEPALLEPADAAAEMHGYRRTFHPGAAVKGKGGQTGLIATWAYSAVPIDPNFGSHAVCGDSTGLVCAVAGVTMPPVVGGACPKSCKPLP
jgi:hypothetical protein